MAYNNNGFNNHHENVFQHDPACNINKMTSYTPLFDTNYIKFDRNSANSSHIHVIKKIWICALYVWIERKAPGCSVFS